MKHQNFTYSLLVALCCLVPTFCLLTACNNDIFIDEPLPADEDLNVVIEGDGGEATVRISTKDLQSIELRYGGIEWTGDCIFYNHKGEIVPSSTPIKDVSKIVCENSSEHYELVINKNSITIRSFENLLPNDSHQNICLNYSYTTEFIHLTILKGQGYEVYDVKYDDIVVDVTPIMKSERETFINNGPLTQTMEVWPMLQAQSDAYGTVILDYNTPLSLYGYTFNMPVLTHSALGWEIANHDGVKIGEKYRISIPNLLDRVNVDVAPNSKLTVKSVVTITQASACGHMTLRAPISGKLYTVDFKCEATFPEGYEVIIEED